MPVKQPEAVWRMAECDEQQWRDMGCPTMGTALSRIRALEARLPTESAMGTPPRVVAPPVALPKPYYEHAGITIYHGDCREILPGLGKFDLLLTDPPYGKNIDTAYADRRGTAPRRMEGCVRGGAMRNNFAPVFGDDAPFDPGHLLPLADAHILWGANHYASKLPDSPCWLAWDRESNGNDSTDVELAWVSGHRFTTVRIFRHVWCGVRRKTEAGPRHKYVHPTQKPVALMSWCLGFFPEAQSVIDPYMGSGPVARACKDAGKRYVGIEIEERYCEIAAKRLAQEVLFA